MNRSPRWSGRLYREGAYLYADFADAAERSVTYGYVVGDVPSCIDCGSPEPVGCHCAEVRRGGGLRAVLAAGLLVLAAGCATASDATLTPEQLEARATCITDSECEAAWGMTLEEAMRPEGGS